MRKSISSFWMDVPAILAGLLGVFFLIAILWWNPTKVRRQYESVAVSALANNDYPRALVAAQRLLAFGGEGRNGAIFLIARAKLGMGRTGDAAGLLEMIGPYDKPVYAPAHLLISRILIDRAASDPRSDQAILAQLRNALALEPNSIEAKALLADLSLRKKNWLDARKNFEEIVESKPEAMFQLIDIARALGDGPAQVMWAGKVLAYYRAKFDSQSPPSAEDRIFYCEALLQSGEFDSALRVLASAPDAEDAAASERRVRIVYRAWADALASSDSVLFLQRVNDLAREIASGPNPHLAGVIIDCAATDYPNDPGVQAVRQQIDSTGSDRSTPPVKKVEQ